MYKLYIFYIQEKVLLLLYTYRRRCGRDRIVVGFTTIGAISAYHH